MRLYLPKEVNGDFWVQKFIVDISHLGVEEEPESSNTVLCEQLAAYVTEHGLYRGSLNMYVCTCLH